MAEDIKDGEKKHRSEKKKKKTGFDRWFLFLHFLERFIFRVIFPYKKHGVLTKYNDGPIILVGNHYSVLDVVYPCLITDKPIHFAAKNDLWKGRLSRWFVTRSECICINRDGNDVKAVMEMMRRLRAGEAIGIFPEGTRNHSYDSFLPFSGGAAAMAIKTKTPIIPFAVVYRTRPFKRNHIIYGEPMYFSEYYGKRLTDDVISACDEKIKTTIWEMRSDFVKSLKNDKRTDDFKKEKK